MKLKTMAACLGLILVFGITQRAFAQLPYRQPSRGYSVSSGPPKLKANRPTVSPYLNLLGNQGVGSGYYNLVRPQQQIQHRAAAIDKSIQSLQSNQALLIQGQQQQPEIGTTGHAATFMSHYRYFGVGLSGSTQGSTRR